MTNFQFGNRKSSRQLHHPAGAMTADDLPGLQRVSPALCGVPASADPTQRTSRNHRESASAIRKRGMGARRGARFILPDGQKLILGSKQFFFYFKSFDPVGRCPPLRGFPLRWSTVGVYGPGNGPIR